MSYWLFQGNPKTYKVKEAIQDFEQVFWTISRYQKEIAVGDGVLLWISGEEAGIYAIAEVISYPKILERELEMGYWVNYSSENDLKPQVKIRLTHKLLHHPLLKVNINDDPILSQLMVIRQPQATNYKVTPEQWKRVYELIWNG